MDKKRIAIIDDEPNIQITLKLALEEVGYEVDIYKSASEALDNIEDNLPEIIILDIVMPGVDGITFCSIFRKKHSKIPIIFLSSKIDELTKLEALERGGDDYLTKPYSIKELQVRISVCLRRINYFNVDSGINNQREGFYIDSDAYQILYNNNHINFSVSEFRIFKALIENPNRVFSRDELMIKAYPEDSYISDRNIDTHITRIRKKIIKVYKNFKGIESVYGVGYRYKEKS